MVGLSTLYEIRNPLGSDKAQSHSHTHTKIKKETRREEILSTSMQRPERLDFSSCTDGDASSPRLTSQMQRHVLFAQNQKPRCCHRNAQSTYTGDSPVPIYGSGGER